jgi:hypothetical protein
MVGMSGLLIACEATVRKGDPLARSIMFMKFYESALNPAALLRSVYRDLIPNPACSPESKKAGANADVGQRHIYSGQGGSSGGEKTVHRSIYLTDERLMVPQSW